MVTRKRLIPTLKALTIVLGTVVASAVVGLMVLSHLREPLIHFFAARTSRDVRVDGSFEAHLFSLHPRLVAERVTIGNPPWTAKGTTAEIGRLSITFDLPLFGQSFAVRRLVMEGASLHLLRDSVGRANWQWTDPDSPQPGPPLTRSLSMLGAQVELEDDRRHLRFKGVVSARDLPGTPVAAFRIDGKGQLNGKPAAFAINADPLLTVSREHPYRFAFDERSSGSRLSGRGSLQRPFDFRTLDTVFQAAGDDLQELYFLTGLRMPDTGDYRLSGKFARQGAHFSFTDLRVTSGHSNLSGAVLIDVDLSSGRSRLDVHMESELLRMSDLGPRAAGRPPPPQAAEPLLLSAKPLRLNGIRLSDAVIHFHAREFEFGRTQLHDVTAKATIEKGILEIQPVSAIMMQGRLTGRIRLDVSHDIPAADLDVRVTDLNLGQLHSRNNAQAPVEGLLRARINVASHGSSVHQLAAAANGTVTAVLPRGQIRASLAELAGMDLRGVGLLITRNKEDTDVRCGVASFRVQDGVLKSQSLILDTTPVLITGSGDVQLDSETLDLTFRGRPKHLRLLRLRAPIEVRGTLSHPSVELNARQSAVQAGEAVALGVVLTPLAAIFAFVDPGLAKDADCGALLSNAKANEPDTTTPGRPPGAQRPSR